MGERVIVTLNTPTLRAIAEQHLGATAWTTDAGLAFGRIDQAIVLPEFIDEQGQHWDLLPLLDQYVLLLPAEPMMRSGLVKAFFDAIGPDYEHMIDAQRNVANIESLLSILEREGVTEHDQMILDFGCGTGLSTQAHRNGQARLVGMDSSPAMRAAAADRGLSTVSEDELNSMPGLMFDGAFASYVLHLASWAEGLPLALAHLRPDAIFVANFHKGWGRQLADATFLAHGMMALEEGAQSDSTCGPLVVYRRAR